MLNFEKTVQLLYMTGCQPPINFDEAAALTCYLEIDRLTGDIENVIADIKRDIHTADLENFMFHIRSLKKTLHDCFLMVLETDCDFLIEHMAKEKYVICETIMERFAANLIGMSVAFQSNRYRMQKMDTSSDMNERPLVKSISPVNRDHLPVVLAVDDSPEILTILKTILGTRLRFFGMASGALALKFLHNHQPDLYIFDIDMPGMNGFELAQKAEIKSSGKPLFFLTSNANRENLITALQVGASDFIVKPCDETIILKKIEAALGVKL